MNANETCLRIQDLADIHDGEIRIIPPPLVLPESSQGAYELQPANHHNIFGLHLLFSNLSRSSAVSGIIFIFEFQTCAKTVDIQFFPKTNN